jgi:hypothetical protein
MCEAFEDVTSMPGLWSNYDKAAHPNFGLSPDESAADVSQNNQAGYLVIANISKKDNIRRLISLAVAYGIENVVIGMSCLAKCVKLVRNREFLLGCTPLLPVGQPHFDLATHAPPESQVPDLAARVAFHRMSDLSECKTFLHERNTRWEVCNKISIHNQIWSVCIIYRHFLEVENVSYFVTHFVVCILAATYCTHMNGCFGNLFNFVLIFRNLRFCLLIWIKRLYGVEIVDGATSIESADFAGHGCAFMMGNEGSGMNPPQVLRPELP